MGLARDAVLTNATTKTGGHDYDDADFTLARQRDLQARFHTATLNLATATHRARDLAAQLDTRINVGVGDRFG